MEILTNVANGVEPKKVREFYCHMSALCLNVILNRLTELGLGAEDTAYKARTIIHNIVKNIDDIEKEKLIKKNASNQC